MKLVRRNISVNLFLSITLKIFSDEFPKVHLKIVLNKLKRRIVITHHEICILAHDVDLANLLLVEFIQKTVIINLILDSVVGYKTLDFHTVIENKKSPVKF